MKILRYPGTNALLVSVVSAIYAFIFIFTANHIEFVRLLSHANTLNSSFWNSWSAFIIKGGMKYIGYAILAITAAIVALTIFRKRKYDEYQVNILARGFIIAGVITVLLLPVALILVLSDKNYAIESMFLLLTIQWLGVLAVDLVYAVKHFK
jgi:hypothetical protein